MMQGPDSRTCMLCCNIADDPAASRLAADPVAPQLAADPTASQIAADPAAWQRLIDRDLVALVTACDADVLDPGKADPLRVRIRRGLMNARMPRVTASLPAQFTCNDVLTTATLPENSN